MSICANDGSIFGSNQNNQYIKTDKGDLVAISGANTMEKQILNDLRIPYKQILKSRICLRAGQVNYLMNHLGLGDNATFVSIKAVYDPASVMEADNYLVWNFYSDFYRTYAMDQWMVLTGNSTHRIEQIYLTNPNPDYKVNLEVMVAVIDDEYAFFSDVINQVGRSFTGLELIDIHTHVIGESIVVMDKASPSRPLVYFTLVNIQSIERTVQILTIEDSSLGDVFLEFLTEFDAIQAQSLFNYILENPSINIDDLNPLEDVEPPVIYFNENYETTGDLITMGGATAVPYNTLLGNDFETQIEFATYSTAGIISKTDLIGGLFDIISDNRDGEITVDSTAINISDVAMTTNYNSITTTGTYSVTFNIEDIAKNDLAHISLNVIVY
jgi:hypothetical protein